MPHPFVRNRATWLAYIALALYGYFLNIFGPITPFLKNELELSYTVSSLHFSAFALGIIGAGLIGNRVIQRVGRWNALWISAFGMSACALLLIAGRDASLTIGASFLMGLVGSLILAVVPSALSDQHGDMRAVALSEANVFSSLFSASAPVLVGWFALSALGWRMALVVAVLAVVVIRVGFNRVSLPPMAAPKTADQHEPPLSILYWLYWTALVAAVSVEFCLIFWSADYLETSLGMPTAEAAQAVSVFLGSMIVGGWRAAVWIGIPARTASYRLANHRYRRLPAVLDCLHAARRDDRAGHCRVAGTPACIRSFSRSASRPRGRHRRQRIGVTGFGHGDPRAAADRTPRRRGGDSPGVCRRDRAAWWQRLRSRRAQRGWRGAAQSLK
ncbi:MAG: MFS transporter [Anaerolineae bacterium]